MTRIAAGLAVFLAATAGTFSWAAGMPLVLAQADTPAAPAAAAPEVDEYGLPLGPGHDITIQKCGNCHSIYEFSGERRSPEGWTATISDMIGKGAAISDAEFAQIQTYLATNLPLAAAPPAVQ